MGKKEKSPVKEHKETEEEIIARLHQLFREATKAGDFKKWEHASVTFCSYDGLWCQVARVVKYLQSIGTNMDELGRFAQSMCRKGTFGFTDEKDIFVFYTAFVDVIQQRQWKQRCALVSRALLGQGVDPGPNLTAQSYHTIIPYLDLIALTKAIEECEKYGTEVLEAMELWLLEDPDHRESFEVDASEFIDLDSPLVKVYLDPAGRKILKDRNEKLWFRQPLRNRFRVALEGKKPWDTATIEASTGLEGGTEFVLTIVRNMRTGAETKFQEMLDNAKKPGDERQDFADTVTLKG